MHRTIQLNLKLNFNNVHIRFRAMWLLQKFERLDKKKQKKITFERGYVLN